MNGWPRPGRGPLPLDGIQVYARRDWQRGSGISAIPRGIKNLVTGESEYEEANVRVDGVLLLRV